MSKVTKEVAGRTFTLEAGEVYKAEEGDGSFADCGDAVIYRYAPDYASGVMFEPEAQVRIGDEEEARAFVTTFNQGIGRTW